MDKGLRLDVEGQTVPCLPGKLAEQKGIIAISHGGIDAEIAGLYLLFQKITIPVCNLDVVHEKTSFWDACCEREDRHVLSFILAKKIGENNGSRCSFKKNRV